ncbi:MAG TPA: 4a-hydroxytetrahydrobiopterin dehydratase [Trueperaceae bacterium]|nr:4a-hydroxytetrahydrobiopterin dehydratase [Trueperaceae bacterium]
MPQTLDDNAVRDRLSDLEGWTLRSGKLHKEYGFRDFSEAFGFLSRVALLAEKRNHHPEIRNSYSTVVIELVSHDAGGVTDKDIDMAEAIQALG